MSDDVTSRVRALADLTLEDLRTEWRRLFGAPPKLRSRFLLARLLAWKIQAEAFGGLDLDFQTSLNRKVPKGPTATPGTLLSREWRGVRHEVEVTDGAVLYLGQRYASLSEVARKITGSRWNGPRFFGLRP